MRRWPKGRPDASPGVIVGFDHHSDEFNLNEREVNAELRSVCPRMAWNEKYGGFWYVSIYSAVEQVPGDAMPYCAATLTASTGCISGNCLSAQSNGPHHRDRPTPPTPAAAQLFPSLCRPAVRRNSQTPAATSGGGAMMPKRRHTRAHTTATAINTEHRLNENYAARGTRADGGQRIMERPSATLQRPATVTKRRRRRDATRRVRP